MPDDPKLQTHVLCTASYTTYTSCGEVFAFCACGESFRELLDSDHGGLDDGLDRITTAFREHRDGA